ncbi:MAG: exodeoxyribonuclease VII large subunit, partial [Terracidiphilus sp.]|nr:exodeoxyribonuclease VII large subunit [Terracidiphilus sp.]
PTPSAAAELITEAQHKIAEHLATLSHRLDRAARFQLLQARQHLSRCAAADRAEARMAALLHRQAQRLDDLAFRLEAALTSQLRGRQHHLAALAAAVLRHDPRQHLAQARERLQAGRNRLQRTLERLFHAHASALRSLDARLHSLSPLAVLDRGYALVLNAEGGVVRSVAQIGPGDPLTTRLADGVFTSRVESKAGAGQVPE